MKAAQIDDYNGPEGLHLADAPKPQAGPGQVLVQVYAASANPFDYKVSQGHARGMGELQLPATLGGDLAGVVVAVGDQTTGFNVGDQVFGQASALSGQGSFAEFTPVKATQLAIKPQSTDWSHAAALPLTASSAYQALVDHLNLQSGQKILIHGGAGGIGSFAIQLAKHLSAFVATTAAGSDVDYVKSLGADQVIDYTTQNFADILKNYNAVYDTIGGDTYKNSFKVLTPGGVIVTMVAQPDEALGAQYQVKTIAQFTQVTTDRLQKIAQLVDQGVLKINIDKTFPLQQAGQALAYLQQGKHHGKVIIAVKTSE